jgi:hypothetical protein
MPLPTGTFSAAPASLFYAGLTSWIFAPSLTAVGEPHPNPKLVLTDADYLVGPGAEMRTGTPHPSVTTPPNNFGDAWAEPLPMSAGLQVLGSPDYFRLCLARYMGFTKGPSKYTLRDYNYILPSEVGGTGPGSLQESSHAVTDAGGSLHVGFNIRATSTSEQYNSIGNLQADLDGDGNFGPMENQNYFRQYAANMDVVQYYLNNNKYYAPGMGDSQGVYPVNQSAQAGIDLSFAGAGLAVIAGSEKHILRLKGDPQTWTADAANAIPGAQQLFDNPFWYVWRLYMWGPQMAQYLMPTVSEGPDAPPSINTPLDPWSYPGVIGHRTTNRPYVDNRFQIDLPKPAQIQMGSDYYYHDPAYEKLWENNPIVTETMVPNYYLVASYSLAKNGLPTYASYYTNGASAVAKFITLKGKIPMDPQLLQTGISLANISPGNQNPGSLLNKLIETPFTQISGSDVGPNKHIGISHKLLSGPNSAMSSMNEYNRLFPYGLRLKLSYGTGSSLIENFDVAKEDPHASPADMVSGSVMSDYFLYEIMKANIVNYKNTSNRDAEGQEIMAQQVFRYYHEIPLAAHVIDNPERYAGFPLDMDEFLPWVSGSTTYKPQNLRAISVGNLFANACEMAINKLGVDFPSPLYPNRYPYGGFDSDTEIPGTNRINYTGFTGQGTHENVAYGEGTIVGQDYQSLLPGNGINGWDAYGSLRHTQTGDPHAAFRWAALVQADYNQQHRRSYTEMLEGALAHGDILVFKVDKHLVTDNGNISVDPIQSFYFPNMGKTIDYFDSQVFFGRKYKYKIYAYVYVIGNEYNYQNPSTFPPLPDGLSSPSQLGPILGFGPAKNHRGHKYRGQIFISTNLRKYVPSSTWTNPILLPIHENNLEEYFDPSYDLYMDLSSRTKVQSMFSPASNPEMPDPDPVYDTLQQINMGQAHWSSAGDVFLVNSLTSDLEEKLTNSTGEAWRVRFVPFFAPHTGTAEESFAYQLAIGEPLNTGKFVIGKVAALKGLSKDDLDEMFPEAADIIDGYMWNQSTTSGYPSDVIDLVNTYGETKLERFRTLFDLPSTLGMTSFNVGSTKEYAWLCKSGAHGSYPTAHPLAGQFIADDDSDGVPNYLDPDWAETHVTHPGTAELEVNLFTSANIIEVPWGITPTMMVLDKPPIFPQAEIYPVKESPDKIKIFLNQSTYTKRFVPIAIEPEDMQLFEDVAIAQATNMAEGLIFSGDDTHTEYEIFRTETPPKSYTDFSGKRIKTLSTQTPTGKNTTGASCLDTIVPNVVYYYCFRARDKNGFISIPSPVLSVQIVNDNGMIYPIIANYSFPPSNIRKTQKTLKRYLEIGVATEQRMVLPSVNNAAPGTFKPSEPPLVDFGGNVWADEIFIKVRLTSKETGRKIDYNIKFTMDSISNPDDTVQDPTVQIATPAPTVEAAPWTGDLWLFD